MFDLVGVTALLLFAALGTWLALRARRAQSRVAKGAGLFLSSLVALAATVALGVALVGFYRINFPPHRDPAPTIRVAGTPDQVAQGARFAAFCAQCHSPNGKAPLVGSDFSR